jgi:hypothetical protein
MITRTHIAWKGYRLRRACNSIRRELALWGLTTYEPTDEELIESVGRAGQAMRQCGMTMAEAAKALQSLGAAGRGEAMGAS